MSCHVETLLCETAGKGCMPLVKFLVEQAFFPLELDDSCGRTPLYCAALEGHLEVVKYLVQSGADLYTKDTIGYTPLHRAAGAGRLEIVRYLISKSDKRKLFSPWNSNKYQTPMHVAAFMGRLNVIRYFIEEVGVPVDGTDWTGDTALHFAAAGGHIFVVQFLLKHNASLTAKNMYGETPATRAKTQGHRRLTEYLYALEGLTAL